MLGPAEAAERWPLMRSDDLLGGAFLPHDGKVVPDDVARALAAGARAGGASILEGVRVDQLLVANGRAVGVRTDQGDLHAEVVVLAGGMWSRAMGLAAGVDLPL